MFKRENVRFRIDALEPPEHADATPPGHKYKTMLPDEYAAARNTSVPLVAEPRVGGEKTAVGRAVLAVTPAGVHTQTAAMATSAIAIAVRAIQITGNGLDWIGFRYRWFSST